MTLIITQVKKALLFGSFVLIVCGSLTALASAHRSGCHRWHSCPSDTGSYVCGDLGYTSGCGPATATPTISSPPVVAAPTVRTRNITTEESIPFSTQTRTTAREYPDYKAVTTPGAPGVKQLTTEITLTNGAETSRKIVASNITRPPTAEIVTKGNRLKPVATLSNIQKASRKNKYDIMGRAKPNSIVVLALNGKRIKRASVNSHGEFRFKNIKITSKSAKITIFNRVGSKEARVSEPYTVNVVKRSFISEYQAQHPKK